MGDMGDPIWIPVCSVSMSSALSCSVVVGGDTGGGTGDDASRCTADDDDPSEV